jgi:hypothetical protein
MIKRSTWIILAIFVVLLIAAFYLINSPGKLKPGPTLTPTATTPAQMLFDLAGRAVSALDVSSGQGKTVSLARETEGWTLLEPKSDSIDVASVESALSQLTAVRIVSTLETTADLAAYGLDQPAYTISITLDDGSQQTVWVGSATPTGSGYYVRVGENSPQVANKYGLDAVIEFLVTPPVPTPTVAPTQSEATSQPTATP